MMVNVLNLTKRSFDIYISLVLLLMSPLFILFFKNYKKAFKNINTVLIGNKTWIGYEESSSKNKLPKIKSGIFSIVDNDKKMEEETVDKINIIYAKDYNIMLDLKILVKNIFKTY